MEEFRRENSKFFGIQVCWEKNGDTCLRPCVLHQLACTCLPRQEQYKSRLAKLEKELAAKEGEREQLLHMCDEMMTKLEAANAT